MNKIFHEDSFKSFCDHGINLFCTNPTGFTTPGYNVELEISATSEYSHSYSAEKAVRGGYWCSKQNAQLPVFWWIWFKEEPVVIVSIMFEEIYGGAEFEFIASDTKECDENGKVLINGTRAMINEVEFENGQSHYCYGLKVTKLGNNNYVSIKNLYYLPGKYYRTVNFHDKALPLG